MKTPPLRAGLQTARAPFSAVLRIAVLTALFFVAAATSVSAVELDIISDATWRCSETEQSGWQEPAFDDSGWGHPVILSVPAGYPNAPTGYIPGTLAQHVWPVSLPTTAYFRKSFTVTGPVQASQAVVRIDDCYEFYLNGSLVGSKLFGLPLTAQTYDITPHLRQGVNVFALKAWDIGGWGAMLFDADVCLTTPWHFEYQNGSPVKLVWQTTVGQICNLMVSSDLTSWSPATGFPQTASGETLEYPFVPGARGFFKIIPLPSDFALIPAGTFQMGDPFAEGDPGELPVHQVYVSAFYLAKHEVSRALWDEVAAWGNAHGYMLGGGLWYDDVKPPNHPKRGMNWYDMVAWCNARSERDGLTPCYTDAVTGAVVRFGATESTVCNWSANGYRLPTEAEWEKAARGGLSGKRFPWGDTITHDEANYYSSSDYTWDISPTRGYHPDYGPPEPSPYTSPVGSFAANGYGLHDMVGNLWEWCWDWRSDTYYATSPASDPRGPASRPAEIWNSQRVARGGGARMASRIGWVPWEAYFTYDIGFRPARSAPPEEFSLIPAGTFLMGDSFAEGDPEDLPVHEVSVSPYLMARREVTKALWDEVRAWGTANGYTDLPVGGAKAADHPVHSIDWYACVKWSNARSEKEGRTPCYTVSGLIYRTGNQDIVTCNWNANGYRLPTEAEWEKAARGGLSGKRFPWGDTITHSQANYYSRSDLAYDISPTRGYHPTYATGETPYTSPAGSFPANSYGLQDMAGNVNEWCWDWHEIGPYSAAPQTDPRGDPLGSYRVCRLGNWFSLADQCRVSFRYYDLPYNFAGNLGFRLARTPDEFVRIPGGTFLMGDTFAEGRPDEVPPREVSVGEFDLATHELTQARWDEVRTWALAHGYADLPTGEGKAPNHPVRAIIYWSHAVQWCNARSEMEGLMPCYTVDNEVFRNGSLVPICNWNANGYRLPTEAEWEKAARGGLVGKRYPWGDTISHSQANYFAEGDSYGNLSGNAGYHPAYATGGQPFTSPVGSFPANAYGLHDMTGNVWEWCWDFPPTTDRHYRSGSWKATPFLDRVAYRGHYDNRPPLYNDNVGLRLARKPAP